LIILDMIRHLDQCLLVEIMKHSGNIRIKDMQAMEIFSMVIMIICKFLLKVN